MSSIFAAIKAFLLPKKKRSDACVMHFDDPEHKHTAACFIDVAPLSIVELFQSEGCKQCPPALPVIHKAAKGPNMLLLTYGVTYFDHMGWKDSTGSAQWDQRQRAYAMKWAHNGVFTPDVVIDGIADGVGAKEGELNEIMMKANQARMHMTWNFSLERNAQQLRIASDRLEADPHDVIVIKFDNELKTVRVGAGANKRKKVEHRNTVLQLMKIGTWTGGDMVIDLPPMPNDKFGRVAFVQAGPGGPIIAVERLS